MINFIKAYYQKNVRLKRTFFLFFSLLFLGLSAQNSSFSKAYQSIFQLQFAQADSVISLFEANTFESQSKPYLKHVSLFFRLATNATNDEIKSNTIELKKLVNEYKSANFKSKNEWYYFFLAEMYVQQSMLLAKVGQEWDAFKAFKQSKTYAGKAFQINANFYPVYKTLGLIKLLEGAIPNQYSSIAHLFGFEGNTQIGAQQLLLCFLKCNSNREKAYQNEAAFILLYASANFSNLNFNHQSLINSYKIEQNQPLMKLAFLAFTKKKPNLLDVRVQVFKSISNNDRHVLPYLNMLKCDWHLAKNELDSAMLALSTFKKLNKMLGFECRFWQRKAWIHFLNKDKNQLQLALKKLKNAKPFSEDDYQVLVEVDQFENLEIHLLKSRYLFDEGFYDEAKAELLQADSISSLWNKKEFNYRLGKIAQMEGDFETALHYFEKVNRKSKKSDVDYFGAYANYNSAEILKSKNQFKLAETKLIEAQAFSKHAYQKSLGAKVNNLLKEVKIDSQTRK